MSQPFDTINAMIRDYMGLSQDRVWNYDENIKAPTDENIFVIVALENETVIGKKSEFTTDSDTGISTDSQYISMAALVNIEICSRGRAALERKEELYMMLDSIIGQQYMEDNNMRITRNGTQILDLSAVEGPGILRRYRLPVTVYYMKSKSATTTQYFDKSKESVEVIES